MKTIREKLDYLVLNARADENLWAAGFDLIKTAPEAEQPGLLSRFAAAGTYWPSTLRVHLPKRFSAEGTANLFEQMLSVTEKVREKLKPLADSGTEEGDFYAACCDFFFRSDAFSSDNDRAAALSVAMESGILPYAKIDPSRALRMSDEAFSACMSQFDPSLIVRMNAVLDTDFTQRTEKASLVLDLLEQLPSRELRSVMLTRLIGYYDQKALTGLLPSWLDD